MNNDFYLFFDPMKTFPVESGCSIQILSITDTNRTNPTSACVTIAEQRERDPIQCTGSACETADCPEGHSDVCGVESRYWGCGGGEENNCAGATGGGGWTNGVCSCCCIDIQSSECVEPKQNSYTCEVVVEVEFWHDDPKRTLQTTQLATGEACGQDWDGKWTRLLASFTSNFKLDDDDDDDDDDNNNTFDKSSAGKVDCWASKQQNTDLWIEFVEANNLECHDDELCVRSEDCCFTILDPAVYGEAFLGNVFMLVLCLVVQTLFFCGSWNAHGPRNGSGRNARNMTPTTTGGGIEMKSKKNQVVSDSIRIYSKEVTLGGELIDDECSICCENIVIGRELKNCGHRFHEECLKKWVRGQKGTHRNCPNCRNPVDVQANNTI